MNNILVLYQDLSNFKYKHGEYVVFNINDPKPRSIHKASVRDRLLHHAIYRILYPFFDKTFISDSFSCRVNKGTHRALNRFRYFFRKISKNNTKTCWVLKCDIKKFFENIDHGILLGILNKYIQDKRVIWLLERVISSFSQGLPLGNLTSQLFVNIYMNEFDQFVKHKLKVKHYIRYADDFIVMSRDKSELEELIYTIGDCLKEELKLDLHPNKIFIRTLYSGVDFLGWVHFPDRRILRTTTKRRMITRLLKDKRLEVVNSYLGLLKHGNTFKLRRQIELL